MSVTSIEWADHSINPIRARLNGATGHYCEKVSSGCTHCYSSRLQSRFKMPAFAEQRRLDVTPFLHEPALQEVLSRKKPTRYFWCDMTDLFGSWVPDEWVDRCFATMALTPQHTHLVLTKRPERMRRYLSDLFDVAPHDDRRTAIELALWEMHTDETTNAISNWPLPNVWLGVSVENRHFKSRIDDLRETPAVVRFLSVEPLLEDVGVLDLRGISWVIVGGESGPGSRICSQRWIRSIVEQCRAASVPVFVKQIGAMSAFGEPGVNGGFRPKDRKGGDMAEWPADLRIRQFPEVRR